MEPSISTYFNGTNHTIFGLLNMLSYRHFLNWKQGLKTDYKTQFSVDVTAQKKNTKFSEVKGLIFTGLFLILIATMIEDLYVIMA